MEITSNKKKRIPALVVAGALCLGLGFTATSANMSYSLASAADDNSIVSSGVNFEFEYGADSEFINADISLNQPVQTFNLTTTNIGDLHGVYAFAVDPATITDLDLENPMLSQTRVNIRFNNVHGTVPSPSTTTDLRTFLTTAYATEHVIAPGQSQTITVTITPPTPGTWRSELPGDAVDLEFGTQYVFSQASMANNTFTNFFKDEGENVAELNPTQFNAGLWAVSSSELELAPLN